MTATIEGKPCKKYGHTLRYARNPHICAECVRIKNRRRTVNKHNLNTLLYKRWPV